MTPGPRPLTVLFVCTGNLARSPYAERRAAHLLADYPMIQFRSAGLPGVPGQPMDEAMAAVLDARCGSPQGHLSRSLTWELLARADVALTFEFAQHMRTLDAWPDQAPKIMGLSQFADIAERLYKPGTGPLLIAQAVAAARRDSMTGDIADPHGRGSAAARRCADEIDDLLARILPVVTGTK